MSSVVRAAVAATVVLCSWVAFAGQGNGSFPTQPDSELTPGSYCKNPDSRRYREKIAYCSRDVDGGEKWAIIRSYNEKLGYRIDRGNRMNFKIDHLIPLCAGGSNDASNLWPQHRSVYEITDPVEGLACEKMAEGKLTQKRAVELIFQAKFHLDQAEDVVRQLHNL